MTQQEKQEILQNATQWFETKIAQPHQKNTLKLTDISEFNVNPFLISYLANFMEGDITPESIAKVLIYPRVLGTSINTTFGNQIQSFASTVLGGYGSTTSGIDLEFTDQLDDRQKYCQLKAGPNTINKDDITTIINHFKSARNLGIANSNPISRDQFVVGIVYGEVSELNSWYKKIQEDYDVLIGKDFWYRLTGDTDFYGDLIKTIGDVALTHDFQKELQGVIEALSQSPQVTNLIHEIKN